MQLQEVRGPWPADRLAGDVHHAVPFLQPAAFEQYAVHDGHHFIGGGGVGGQHRPDAVNQRQLARYCRAGGEGEDGHRWPVARHQSCA